jgi:hypothetical protein
MRFLVADGAGVRELVMLADAEGASLRNCNGGGNTNMRQRIWDKEHGTKMWGEYCAGQIVTAARLGMAMYFLCFTLHDTPIQYITYYIDRTSLIALTSSVFSGPFQFSVCFSFGLFSKTK